MRPTARRQNLVIQPVGGEIVVYDADRFQAHRLNSVTAAVWRHCDGRRTLRELCDALESELGIRAREPIIRNALEQLSRLHLLVEPVSGDSASERLSRAGESGGLSRREAIGVGVAGAASVLLAGCESITAPAPHQIVYAASVALDCRDLACNVPRRGEGGRFFCEQAGACAERGGAGLCRCTLHLTTNREGNVTGRECVCAAIAFGTHDNCGGQCGDPIITTNFRGQHRVECQTGDCVRGLGRDRRCVCKHLTIRGEDPFMGVECNCTPV